jgi:hypothetical protein
MENPAAVAFVLLIISVLLTGNIIQYLEYSFIKDNLEITLEMKENKIKELQERLNRRKGIY